VIQYIIVTTATDCTAFSLKATKIISFLYHNFMTQSDDNNSNVGIFLEEMQGIQPIVQDKIELPATDKFKVQNAKYRQNAAVKRDLKYQNFLTDGEVLPVAPNEVLDYKISGIQPLVYKNLRNAKYKFDYRLDLHRYTIAQAREAVFELVSSGEIEDLRCFLIIHGKGERSTPPAKLKSYLNHWLRQIEQVVAFHSALAQHGGTGSLYVLLKKSKQKKRVNQVKYQ
jgi:DNA-nicking Smr family endonuclease